MFQQNETTKGQQFAAPFRHCGRTVLRWSHKHRPLRFCAASDAMFIMRRRPEPQEGEILKLPRCGRACAGSIGRSVRISVPHHLNDARCGERHCAMRYTSMREFLLYLLAPTLLGTAPQAEAHAGAGRLASRAAYRAAAALGFQIEGPQSLMSATGGQAAIPKGRSHDARFKAVVCSAACLPRCAQPSLPAGDGPASTAARA